MSRIVIELDGASEQPLLKELYCFSIDSTTGKLQSDIFRADGALVEGAGQVVGPVSLLEVGECVGRT